MQKLTRDQLVEIVNAFGVQVSFETETAARLFYVPGTGFLATDSSEPELPEGNLVFLTEFARTPGDLFHRVVCLRKTATGYEVVRGRRLDVTEDQLTGSKPLSLAVQEIAAQLGMCHTLH